MYPIEYICTKEEIINTGISIDTVKESKLNPHEIFNDSESIHLNKWIWKDVERSHYEREL